MWSFFFLWSTATPAQDLVNSEPTDDFEFPVALGADFNGQVFSAWTGSLSPPEGILTAAHGGSDLPRDLVIAAGRAVFGPSTVTQPALASQTAGSIPTTYPLRMAPSALR